MSARLMLALGFLGSVTAVSSAQQPREPRAYQFNVGYSGTVTGVTENSITIQFNDSQPKEFAISEVLARGDIPKEPRHDPVRGVRYFVAASSMYRLSDVKVGDWVNIRYAQINGVSTCDHVSITKRPGRKVPPLPKEAEDMRKPTPFSNGRTPVHIPYNEWMDAHWNLEDNGIPYPTHFPLRMFPQAPPPREVKRDAGGPKP